ncbi:MAG: hypothetical protein HYR55_16950 [Acidobacteria bacterium]|nr:hypothetical protein [Acidobacteriota bacterium]MBI3655527.1 hypothetical protein [Acidobacteriota bacterium]
MKINFRISISILMAALVVLLTPTWANAQSRVVSSERVASTRNEFGQPVAYVIRHGQTFDELWQHNPNSAIGWLHMADSNPARTFVGITATQNSLGQPVVFVVDSQFNIFEHNPSNGGNGWLGLRTARVPDISGQISATQTDDGQPAVFAVTRSSELWSWFQTAARFSDGWTQMTTAANYRGIGATRNEFGQASVFVVDGSGELFEFNRALGGNNWRSLSNQCNCTGEIAATQNATGKPVVFVLDAILSLWHFNSDAGGWSLLSSEGNFVALSATRNYNGNPVVFADDGSARVWEWDREFGDLFAGNGWALLSPLTNVWGGVAAVQNRNGEATVFAVDNAPILWQFDPSFGGTGWQPLHSL